MKKMCKNARFTVQSYWFFKRYQIKVRTKKYLDF